MSVVMSPYAVLFLGFYIIIIWNDLEKMLQKIVYCIAEWHKIILHHIPDKVVIDFKIAMCYTVTHAFNSWPRNFRARRKQLSPSFLVNTLKCLADGFNQHTIGS